MPSLIGTARLLCSALASLAVGAILCGPGTLAFAAEKEGGFEESLLHWCSPALREVTRRQTELQAELERLGTPMVGQTVAEFGYQSPRLSAPPLNPPWVQVDLQSRQEIDWIALVPAQVDWQALERPAYGFPRRFRVDVSDDADFHAFVTVADFTDADVDNPGDAPVAVRVKGVAARFVRLTVTKLAVENGQYFFALAELMVLGGNRDVAIGCPVQPSAAFNLPPRWSAENLVDGWTPLGPPIRRELLPYDALYADEGPNQEKPWMMVDLGRDYPIQEVRLHPAHARIGADVPGFAFPTLFRVEAGADSKDPTMKVLFETGSTPFPNPGNNPVTIPAHGIRARYIRVQSLKEVRIGLSEIQIYADGQNVARQGTVSALPDRSNFSRAWPKTLLIDGFASYGRLMEWPEWLESWSRRSALRHELADLGLREAESEAQARRRLAWWSAGAALMILSAAGALTIRARRRRRREITSLRLTLARDLHDEIGSNLAALAVLSEYALESGEANVDPREEWTEVNRIAHETTDSMREVLWLMGARVESGIDLPAHLQLAARRILPGLELKWVQMLERVPAALSTDARRQIFLFFKEALANVARHSAATTVEFLTELRDGEFRLEIRDNGIGFAQVGNLEGMGLQSLRARAKALGGRASFEAAPGEGTSIALIVPV